MPVEGRAAPQRRTPAAQQAELPINVKKRDKLAQVFGYREFRPGQEAIVDALLAGHDVLAVMPTGAGKSLTYQLPALLFDGLTLVISPLLSLMADQVANLKALGVAGAYLNSSLTYGQQSTVLKRAAAGAYKIMYVAPERLSDPRFIEFCQNNPIPLIAVDEAHCVSQWGHDFRPAYLEIAQFIASLPKRPPVAALTATATRAVRDDIRARLALESPFMTVTGFDRANLTFGVKRTTPRAKLRETLEFISRHKGESGIVYCATRNAVDEVCNALVDAGYDAVRYRGGISNEERRTNQEAFVHDDAHVIVATNAFGMGIDKPDVRFVLHYNMPKNLEAYYQEAGRAGRDGDAAECLLLFSESDIVTARFLIERNEVDGQDAEALDAEEVEAKKRNDLRLLNKMIGYCRTTECLRAYLLDYFGEPHRSEGCNNCSNCTGSFETTDITGEARIVLACVRELGRRTFGKGMVADILRGADTKRIRELGLERLDAYGRMRGSKADDVKDIIDSLANNGYLSIEGDKYPVVVTGPRASELDSPNACITVRTEVVVPQAPKVRKRPAAETEGLSQRGEELFERLRVLRKEIADVGGVPPYVVFSNATLRDMCLRCPTTDEELIACSGVGKAKLARYGERFMREIAAFRMETGYGGSVDF